jgi:hypothetical protein
VLDACRRVGRPNRAGHNPWGSWNPVLAQIPQEQSSRHIFAAKKLPSREAAAVYRTPPIECPRRVLERERTAASMRREQAPNPRDPLYFETVTTRPIDFHSFRRVFNTALAEARNASRARTERMRAQRSAGGLGGSGRAPPKRIPRISDAGTEPRQEARRNEAQVISRIPSIQCRRRESLFSVRSPASWTEYREARRPPVGEGMSLSKSAGEGSRTPDLARMKRPL